MLENKLISSRQNSMLKMTNVSEMRKLKTEKSLCFYLIINLESTITNESFLELPIYVLN